MTHRGHGAIGIFALVAAIAYAFGNTTARVIVGGTLIAVPLMCLYVVLVWGL